MMEKKKHSRDHDGLKQKLVKQLSQTLQAACEEMSSSVPGDIEKQQAVFLQSTERSSPGARHGEGDKKPPTSPAASKSVSVQKDILHKAA